MIWWKKKVLKRYGRDWPLAIDIERFGGSFFTQSFLNRRTWKDIGVRVKRVVLLTRRYVEDMIKKSSRPERTRISVRWRPKKVRVRAHADLSYDGRNRYGVLDTINVWYATNFMRKKKQKNLCAKNRTRNIIVQSNRARRARTNSVHCDIHRSVECNNWGRRPLSS